MRQTIVLAATMAAFAVALVIGPLGTAAAGPYVFGCGPLSPHASSGTGNGQIDIYNGSAATANLTHKILAGDGTQLQVALIGSGTSTLAPTKTEQFFFSNPLGEISPTNSTIPAIVRVVSDVPVGVYIMLNTGATVLNCTDLRP
jgi:hypothetical protein